MEEEEDGWEIGEEDGSGWRYECEWLMNTICFFLFTEDGGLESAFSFVLYPKIIGVSLNGSGGL